MTLAFDFERLNSVTSQPQKSLIQSKPNIKQFSRTIYKMPRHCFQLSWIKITPKKHNPTNEFWKSHHNTQSIRSMHISHTPFSLFSWSLMIKEMHMHSFMVPTLCSFKKSYIENVLFNVSDRSTLQKAKRFITLPNVGKLCQMPK